MEELSPEALLQLAQYQPCRDAGSTKDATFEQMVPAVLMESGGSLAGPDELCHAFYELFGVEIEQNEAQTWLEHLKRAGTINWNDGIHVSDATRRSLEQRKRDFEGLTNEAFEGWQASLLLQEHRLDESDINGLWGDLNQLISVTVAYHGAEAALILYPEEPRSRALRDTLNRQVEVLPERGPRLDEVRRKALLQFFSNPTESQRRYLADRLDHGFFATVGTLRRGAALIMREELSGQRLYLDTNVLIPALGVAGRRVGKPARRLLSLTRKLGVDLVVTSRTLEEYQSSLRRAREFLEGDLPKRRYAGVMRKEARRIGGISLAEGYYESYERNGAHPADWFRRAAIVKPQLEELEIEEVNDELAMVTETEGPRIEEYVQLLAREAMRQRRERDELPMKHDVIHRLLVERLRGGTPEDFRSAKHWFLTEDKLLPHFGLQAIPGEPTPRVPFCMSGSAWAQIARCFTPRTADYDQMVTDLLASPYVSFGRTRSFGEVQQVVNRITSLLDDASPAVVAAFVGDEVLEAVAGAPDQAEKDEVLVEAYEQKKDDLKENLDALTAELERTQAELATSEGRAEDVDRLTERLQALERALDEEQTERSRERALEAEEIRNLRAQRDRDKREHKEELRELEGSHEAELQRRKRIVLIVAFALAEVAAVALRALDLISWGLLLIIGGMVVALILAPVFEQSRLAARTGFLLAVLGVLLSVVQLM